MRVRNGKALLAASALCAALAAPVRADITICIDQVLTPFKPVAIPVGCEIVDCCPGCPAGDLLDWHVRATGDALESAELRFEGGGVPERSERLRPGESVLEKVGAARGEGAPRTASISLALDPGVVDGWRRQAEAVSGEIALGEVTLELEQRLGPLTVGSYREKWVFRRCVPLPLCDRVVQNGNGDGDRSVILMDYRRFAGAGGCRVDVVQRSPGTLGVGNALAAAGCRSEVSVFSARNSMQIRENAPWTDSCGDTVRFDLKPLLAAPMTLWVAIPSAVSFLWWGEIDPSKVVKEDLAYASQAYDENKTGIGFDASFEKVSNDDWKKIQSLLPKALLASFQQSGEPVSTVCGIPGQLETDGFYQKGRLNVYYLPLPFTGMICDDDRNVIFVGLVKKPATLAHELGHSFSLLGPLGHSNGAPGIGNDNIMWVRESAPRDRFSLGQAFRENVDPKSTLNVNGVRSGPLRSCPPAATSSSTAGACPDLGLDWSRP
jgi:hypothetical protein